MLFINAFVKEKSVFINISLLVLSTMVARTAKSEAINLKNIETAKLIGTDIVEFVSHHPNPCSVCVTYNGRRFSISGKNKDYPALFEKLLPNGYYVVHPNCRCELRPVILQYEDEETTKAKKEYSNSEFKDPRTEKQKELYDKWQSDNRRNAREVREYSEMKAVLGDKMPYKTIGGFRRASRSNSIPTNLKKYQYMKRDTAQYERWSEIVGKENMSQDIDSFQEMKYNDIDKFEDLKNRKNFNLKLQNGTFSKSLHEGKQGKHIQGHNNFIQGKSYLTISMKECQDIINKYAGTGKIIITESGNITNKEIVQCNKDIGWSVNYNTKEITRQITIHYSKTGAHIVPKGDSND